ncbi:MAG: ABC transporter ATP-binding protein [Pseudomonadota bacterium]
MTLTLSDVAKTFEGGTTAVRPTALTIETGEILALLGPSGCGKTTLLRMIAGLETPDPGGAIRFGAEDVTALPVERRQVGMVFQSYALFPNMSVRRNIAYGLKMQGLAADETAARVDEVVAMCGLGDHVDKRVTALSGGQRQRVALARAVAPRPRVLLLDEPLSALDAALRDRLRDELAELLRRFEITAIFVTHDQTEALAIADRVAVMNEGRVEQTGTPEELYRSPASPFVAEFVGHAVPLDGRPEDTALHLAGGTLTLPEPLGARRAFIRAEDVRLAPDGPLSGRVERTTFVGTHYRLAISGVTDRMLFATLAARASPAVGERVTLSIDADAVLLVAADSA